MPAKAEISPKQQTVKTHRVRIKVCCRSVALYLTRRPRFEQCCVLMTANLVSTTDNNLAVALDRIL
jgi:hypothetical protein